MTFLRDKIVEISGRFISDLKNGREPQIEVYLIEISGEGRSELLFELLREELGFRRQIGDSVQIEALLERFPQHEETVNKAFFSTVPGRDVFATAAQANSFSGAAAPSHSSPDNANRNRERYRKLSPLGKGSFGVVWLAEDLELRRKVALKEPHSVHLRRASQIEMFLSEARTLASLDHANIVPVFDVGRTNDGNCFVVSKHIDGSDLKSLMAGRRLAADEAVKIVARVANALHFAHQKGIIHRDIKPANILIDKRGEPWVTDFGIALQDDQVGSGPVFVGTPAYMSPEQLSGNSHRVDGRTDIYSLGVVLYELLTGRRPFRANDEKELSEQICTMDAKPLRQIDDEIPQELERVCLKALSRTTTDRYTTAKDFSAELTAILAGEVSLQRHSKRTVRRPGIHLTSGIVLKQQTAIGNCSAFWIAEDLDSHSEIAVSFLNAAGSPTIESLIQHNEMVLQFRDLLHPHVCLFVDSGTHEDLGLWVAVKLPPGQSLRDYCQSQLEIDGIMNLSTILDLLEQLASTVDFLHRGQDNEEASRQITLGNLAPSTIWITSDLSTSRPVSQIIPFPPLLSNIVAGEVATVAPTSPEERSMASDYLAPEVHERKAIISASDQYSLAVIAYELLTTSLPFRTPRLSNTLVKAIRGLPQLTDVFQKALAWNPDDRFSTCNEFIVELKARLVSFQNVSLEQNQMTGVEISQEAVSAEKLAPQETHGTSSESRVSSKKTKEAQLKDSRILLEQKTREFNDVQHQMDLLTRELRIAMVGTRGAGKTSLFASWYLFRGDPQLKLDLATSGETQEYLKKISDQLRRHGSTNATPVAEPNQLSFRISYEGRIWDVKTIDFSGELLNPQAKEDEVLARSTVEFLRSCDLVFLLHDPVETEVELLDAIDTLFQNRTAEVILLLTKFDRFCTTPESRKKFQELYRTYLDNNPILRSLYNKVKSSYSECRLTVVPVSAIGRTLNSSNEQALEISEFRPFQIFMPLMLAFKRRKKRIDDLEKRKSRLNEQVAKLKLLSDSLEESCRTRAEKRAAAVSHYEKLLGLLEENLKEVASRIPISVKTLRRLTAQSEKIRGHANRLEEAQLESQAIQLKWKVQRVIEERITLEISGRLQQLSEQLDRFSAWEVAQQAARIRSELIQLEASAIAKGLQEQTQRSQTLLASLNLRLARRVAVTCAAFIGTVFVIVVLFKIFSG